MSIYIYLANLNSLILIGFRGVILFFNGRCIAHNRQCNGGETRGGPWSRGQLYFEALAVFPKRRKIDKAG